jgi:hypothetical protein
MHMSVLEQILPKIRVDLRYSSGQLRIRVARIFVCPEHASQPHFSLATLFDLSATGARVPAPSKDTTVPHALPETARPYQMP